MRAKMEKPQHHLVAVIEQFDLARESLRGGRWSQTQGRPDLHRQAWPTRKIRHPSRRPARGTCRRTGYRLWCRPRLPHQTALPELERRQLTAADCPPQLRLSAGSCCHCRGARMLKMTPVIVHLPRHRTSRQSVRLGLCQARPQR